jgi:hypothetical protein
MFIQDIVSRKGIRYIEYWNIIRKREDLTQNALILRTHVHVNINVQVGFRERESPSCWRGCDGCDLNAAQGHIQGDWDGFRENSAELYSGCLGAVDAFKDLCGGYLRVRWGEETV